MTNATQKFNFKKFLQISLLTLAVFSNIGLAIAAPATTTKPPAKTTGGTPAAPTPTPAPVDAKAEAEKLLKASEAAAKAREAYSKFDVKILKVDGQNQSYLVDNIKTGQASSNPLASFILQIINFITLTVASVTFLGVVIGGFMIMSSAGNENQVNKGKDILQHALIGLVLTLTAYFVIAFVQSLLFETVK